MRYPCYGCETEYTTGNLVPYCAHCYWRLKDKLKAAEDRIIQLLEELTRKK